MEDTQERTTGRRSGASEAEWAVMDVLWRRGPLPMREMAAELREARGWSRSTVLTLASRLEKKGFIGTERSQKAFLYVPLLNRKQAQRDSLSKLLHSCFKDDIKAFAKAVSSLAAFRAAETEAGEKDLSANDASGEVLNPAAEKTKKKKKGKKARKNKK